MNACGAETRVGGKAFSFGGGLDEEAQGEGGLTAVNSKQAGKFRQAARSARNSIKVTRSTARFALRCQ